MTSLAPRGARLGAMVTGWTNIALGVLTGFAAVVGFLSGGLGGAEIPFFILVACLLVASGAFGVALRPVPVTMLGVSLLLLGLFLGFGLLVGGAVFGAADAAVTKAVGIAGALLAGLESFLVVSVWRARRRPAPPGDPESDTPSEEANAPDGGRTDHGR